MSRECCEKAVQLAAFCKEINYLASSYKDMLPEALRKDYNWYATLWCNVIGEYIVGYGTTALEAVEDAHARDRALQGTSGCEE